MEQPKPICRCDEFETYGECEATGATLEQRPAFIVVGFTLDEDDAGDAQRLGQVSGARTQWRPASQAGTMIDTHLCLSGGGEVFVGRTERRQERSQAFARNVAVP